MDYIEVFKDKDLCEIVGVHCDFAISEIFTMSEEFDSYSPEEIGINQDGIYFLKPIIHAAEFEEGGLVNGSWYDFKVIDFKELDLDQV